MNMAAEQVQGVIVFFSYAKRDKILRDRLEEHLSNLKYKGLIQTWHDRDILAGSDWLEQIDISLHNAQIILLLISSTFMASDYCYSKEMQQALQLHAQKKATVIPILLRPVLYTGAPFARLSILPTNGKPVTSWRDRDSAFVDVALNIEKVAMYYVQNRPVDQPIPSSQPSSPLVQDLSASTPSPQVAAVPIAPAMDWPAPAPYYGSPDSAWGNPDLPIIAADSPDAATTRSGGTGWTSQAIPAVRSKIEEPAHLILRTYDNENVRDYVLDKPEMSIGRARGSDILLSRDKWISRRHATIFYKNGQYSIRDERSVNGTFVNSQQLDESSSRVLQNGDHIGIGEHELIFQTVNSSSSEVDIESMPAMAVSPPSVADLTFRTQEDPNLTASADDDYGVHLISEAIRRAYYTESVAAYERVLSHTPGDDEALRGLGKALYGLARYNEALDAFRRALQSRETSASYAGLGDVLVKRKNYREAVTAYKKARQLDPDVTLDYPAFIHALREIGRADEADRMYARARDLGFFDDAI